MLEKGNFINNSNLDDSKIHLIEEPSDVIVGSKMA